MSEITTLSRVIQLYDYAIQNNISITKTLEIHDLDESYIRKFKTRCIERLKLGKILREDYDTLMNKVEEYNNFTNRVKEEKIINKINTSSTRDINFEDNFEEKRSRCWTERDEQGKIFKYCYEIQIRDEKPLVGNLSRSEMERLFALYPSFSTNYVSRSFLNFERKDLQRVLRVFGITKDKLFPPHLIEEYDENQLANFALKAKEINGYHKYNENKGLHFEKAFRESQVELNRERENNKFLEELIERHYTKRNGSGVKVNDFVLHPDDANVGYVAFADVHFGKCFNGPKMGRGYNKLVAFDRMMQIADETAKFILKENINHLELLSLGDIVESILESGMHQGHYKSMDLYEEEQILYAIETIEDMVIRILKLVENHNVKIVLRAIGGNHDRIAETRDGDKSRTANKLIFKILTKNLKQYGVEVDVPHDNIIRTVKDGICIIGFHGDNGLHKRKTSELVNLFSAGIENYHVIMSGHFHSLNAEFSSTTNALRLVLPSVCSVDEYIQNDLGLLNLPGFLLGKRKYNSFKFTIEPLY